jgi:hypothetical protein
MCILGPKERLQNIWALLKLNQSTETLGPKSALTIKNHLAKLGPNLPDRKICAEIGPNVSFWAKIGPNDKKIIRANWASIGPNLP